MPNPPPPKLISVIEPEAFKVFLEPEPVPYPRLPRNLEPLK